VGDARGLGVAAGVAGLGVAAGATALAGVVAGLVDAPWHAASNAPANTATARNCLINLLFSDKDTVNLTG
jgi:hypothetical protein